MERKKEVIPAVAAIGGLILLFIRRWNLSVGFEPITNLAVRGSVSFAVFFAVSVATALAILILTCMYIPAPKKVNAKAAQDCGESEIVDSDADQNTAEQDAELPTVFPFPFKIDWSEHRAFAVFPIAGAFVLMMSGAADLFEGFTGMNLMYRIFSSSGIAWRYEYIYNGLIEGGTVGMSMGVQCFSGLLSILSAWVILNAMTIFAEGEVHMRGLMLIPTIAVAYRMVSLYRMNSVNPVLEDYTPGLVAAVFIILAFYKFSEFAFSDGNMRGFTFYSACAVMFTLCTLTDSTRYASTVLMQLGSALTLFGFSNAALCAMQMPNE